VNPDSMQDKVKESSITTINFISMVQY
jgi:hypothetical protein